MVISIIIQAAFECLCFFENSDVHFIFSLRETNKRLILSYIASHASRKLLR